MPETNVTLAPPKTLILMITNKCNLQCSHCVTIKDFPELLMTGNKKKCLVQFKKLNPQGEVWLSGGEPLLKTKEVFELIKTAQQLGLSCGLTTNGLFINDSKRAEKIVNSGLKYLSISLESHRQEINDLVRGPGTYERIVRAVKLLQEAKSKYKKNIPIITLTLTILDLNYMQISEFISFAKKLQAEGVFLQTLVGNNKHWPKSEIQFRQALQELYNRVKDDPFVVNRHNLPYYIENCKSALFTEREICNSYEQNIYIDTMGYFRLCCYTQSIGCVKDKDLKNLWYSSLAADVRQSLKNCLLRCGLFSTHVK